jgi:ABC-type branched-subunit amino acid transport system permease subunit
VYGGASNPWITLALSLGAVIIVSTAIAHLVVPRSSGIYYSMITLAFAQAVYFITFHWGDLTGGEDGLQGITRPHLPGLDTNWMLDANHVYLFTATVTFIAVAANYWIVNSRFGSVLHAIRENKQRARFLGYDVNKYRINAFVLSALFPGVGGWLWTYFQQAINPDAGSVDYSGRVVMMSLLGGIHSFAGPILGTAVYWDLQNQISQHTKYWNAAIGLIFALFVIFVPGGITGLVKLFRNRFAKENG